MAVQPTPLDSVTPMLVRVASSINEDTTLPLRVPVLTILFLRRLGSQCDRSTRSLGRFLALVPCSRLVDEITRILLPREFQELRAELERIQRFKEDAVASQEYRHAVALLDQTTAMKDRLRQMGEGNAIDVQPDHVLQAIANLGFNEAIGLSE